jgi:hypothetical protein
VIKSFKFCDNSFWDWKIIFLSGTGTWGANSCRSGSCRTRGLFRWLQPMHTILLNHAICIVFGPFSGQLLNIDDAYSHPLFYRGVDDTTGFKTRWHSAYIPPSCKLFIVNISFQKYIVFSVERWKWSDFLSLLINAIISSCATHDFLLFRWSDWSCSVVQQAQWSQLLYIRWGSGKSVLCLLLYQHCPREISFCLSSCIHMHHLFLCRVFFTRKSGTRNIEVNSPMSSWTTTWWSVAFQYLFLSSKIHTCVLATISLFSQM